MSVQNERTSVETANLTGDNKMKVSIWKMGNFYKVYSENTGLIRQLANADGCKVMCSYFKRHKLVALDAILPFCAKSGRRIVRILNKEGFGYKDKKPNLVSDEVLEIG